MDDDDGNSKPVANPHKSNKKPDDVVMIELLEDTSTSGGSSDHDDNDDTWQGIHHTKNSTNPKPRPKKAQARRRSINQHGTNQSALQKGLVLQEDSVATTLVPQQQQQQEQSLLDLFLQQLQQRQSQGKVPLLFEDDTFEPVPSSIQGHNNTSNKSTVSCNCRTPAKLSHKVRGRRQQQQQQQYLYPYYHCPNNGRCNYFSWAYSSELMQWYRFGSHTGHVFLVKHDTFRADHCQQGKVGDCWFLSALAVVAERPDLIARLFVGWDTKSQRSLDHGFCKVNLFLDGQWRTVVVDTFLPCLVDGAAEVELQAALQASRMYGGSELVSEGPHSDTFNSFSSSSKYDPHAVADKCRTVLTSTHVFLEQDQRRQGYNNNHTNGHSCLPLPATPTLLQRPATSTDLAYSKAKHNQLWVPLLEKAYAKSHGSYSAISGGHIAEAFLDLTGAPTLCYRLHNDSSFEPRSFWYKLLQYRRQRLPMGCGTDSSAVGIIGRHAYSILDVVELKNVSFAFFQETGVAHGNVSGFTEYDGTVRLLKIRNPHGRGEWKGDFSDQSKVWERLLQEKQPQQQRDTTTATTNLNVQRTMKNDGTFWIDYDNFLMGFSNVDVLLAFMGNHAKSFSSNFAPKKSNHRCTRAFEVSLLDEQPGLCTRDTVELYVMGIQKTRRGARHGREDRKKSYKVCDLGMLVGENHTKSAAAAVDEDELTFTTVKGQMFGFKRNGHYRLILDRKKSKSLVVMPISFGHPAATDKELSFVLRFVSDAPLYIRELPTVPRMDVVVQKFCLSSNPPHTKQGIHRVLLEEDGLFCVIQVDCRGNGGGTVFLYLCVNEKATKDKKKEGLSFSVEASCRGMTCRTEEGLLPHETIAKGKMYEAAWRRYSAEFLDESRSRLLLVLFQSGQDTEFSKIVCKRIATPQKLGSCPGLGTLDSFLKLDPLIQQDSDQYENRGIFNAVDENDGYKIAVNFGANRKMIDGHEEFFDMELERALALSRNDLELQRALELSQAGRGGTDYVAQDDLDVDLQRALELSKSNSIPSHFASGDGIRREEDPDVARAIQLSMKEMDNKRQATSGFVDVTETVDLTKDDDDEVLQNNRVVPSKRRKTNQDVADNTVAIDSRGTKARSGDSESKANDSADEPLDLAEKRRHAAEAAMKRFEKQS